jgi:hypothetical protein
MSEIDLPTLVVSSVILLAVLAPFIYYSIKRKKSKAEFFKRFEHFTSGLNLNPDLKEDWRNRYILALDTAKKVLIYYQSGENEEKREISLKEVNRVSLHQTYIEINSADGNRKILDQLALQVHLKNSAKPVLNLEIYNSEYFSDLVGESVLAAKWAELINQQLTK